MAHEKVSGEAVGPAADLYALGLTLAETLTGAPVFADENPMIVYLAQISPTPVPLPRRVLDSPLGPIVVRATAKRVQERYASAEQMLAAIEAARSLLGSPSGSVVAVAPSGAISSAVAFEPTQATPALGPLRASAPGGVPTALAFGRTEATPALSPTTGGVHVGMFVPCGAPTPRAAVSTVTMPEHAATPPAVAATARRPARAVAIIAAVVAMAGIVGGGLALRSHFAAPPSSQRTRHTTVSPSESALAPSVAPSIVPSPVPSAVASVADDPNYAYPPQTFTEPVARKLIPNVLGGWKPVAEALHYDILSTSDANAPQFATTRWASLQRLPCTISLWVLEYHDEAYARQRTPTILANHGYQAAAFIDGLTLVVIAARAPERATALACSKEFEKRLTIE
jgi:hypothetical protein